MLRLIRLSSHAIAFQAMTISLACSILIRDLINPILETNYGKEKNGTGQKEEDVHRPDL